MADLLGSICSIEVIQTMKVAELKKELKARGLTVSGNKTELIERLQEALGLPKDSSIVEDRINSECLEGLENLEAADDVNEDEVLSDDVLYGEEQKGTEPSEINEEEILSPINSTEIVLPVKNTIKLQRKHVTVLHDTLQETDLQKDSTPDKSNQEKQLTENNDSSVDNKKVVVTLTKDMTQEERLALRAKRFSNGTDNKLKVRAERFGTLTKTENTIKSTPSKIGTMPVDLDCLKKRAERFGQNVSTVMKQIEEKSRILKRKERFGASAVTTENDISIEINEKERKLKLLKLVATEEETCRKIQFNMTSLKENDCRDTCTSPAKRLHVHAP